MKENDRPLDRELENRLERFKDVPARAPAATERGRVQFLEQAASLRAHTSGQAPSRQVRHFGSVFPAYPAPKRKLAMNFLRGAVLALLILFGGGTLTVYASQGSLPGDRLYPVKTLSEDTLLSLTASPDKRVSLNLEFADRRLAEMAKLQADGRPIPQEVANRYSHEVDQTLELAAGMEEPAMVQSLQTFSSHAEKQLKTMDALLKKDSNLHVVVEARNALQEQVNEAQQGQVDPQSFRQQRQGKSHSKGDTPGSASTTNASPAPATAGTNIAPPPNPSSGPQLPPPPKNNPDSTPGKHDPGPGGKPDHGHDKGGGE
jgi:hypothetical protein